MHSRDMTDQQILERGQAQGDSIVRNDPKQP